VAALRVIFAGTPEFAQIALERIRDSGHTIALVLTQPDRPAGRGMKLSASAVKQFAMEYAIPVAQPRSLRLDGKFPDDAAQTRQAIANAKADVMVVAAYGLILPQWVLDDMSLRQSTCKFGCINIHGSLLPRWRGAAPIHRAIEAGDTHTGVTIMQMDAGLDTGDILMMQSVPIEGADTTATLHDKLAQLGALMVVDVLEQAGANVLKPMKQPEADVTYARKIEKYEAAIDWSQTAQVIVRRVRAFNPFPGATVSLNGETIKVWAAEVGGGNRHSSLRSIVDLAPSGIAVAAMNSIVVLTQLQRPGGKRLAAADFLHGFDLQVGMQLDSAADHLA
jgi:methionyl-tRNA formyltransferase